jgi:hypothetical protein
MKNLFLTIVSILTTTILFSQDNIWVKIPNYDQKSKEVNQSLSDLNITEIRKAFPSSRNLELKQVYEITCNCDVNDLLQFTSKNSLFVKPEMGPQYQTLEVPNDYTIQGFDWALNSVNAEGSWNITHGDPSITIAISDANYYQYHEELAMKVDWITPENYDNNYTHGTAVATTAAGNTNNGTGKSSIGYNSHLQLRRMDYNEILDATYSGAKVINTSWASSCYFNSYAQAVIDETYNNGSIIIAAAGNGGTCGGAQNLVYPASFEHVISVSSIGSENNHQRITGDDNSTHQHNTMVDIVAPGYDLLLSTAPGQYVTGSGTSFAAPMVSGTVALMLSVNKCLTPDQIEWILRQSADSTIYNYNSLYIGQLGSGKLNSQRAVEMAKRFNTLNGSVTKSVNCILNIREASVNSLSGQYPYTYLWSNGETEDKITIDTTNIYSVEVTDSNGCKFYYEQLITKYNPIQIQSDIENVKCKGEESGEISVMVTGGEGELSYLWSNEQTESFVTNLKAKDYSVVISDQTGCNKFETWTITEPEKLETSMNWQQPTEINFGSIDLEVSGGVKPYQYSWNHGEISEDLNNVISDFYEVLVTDFNGCMSSENVILENLINSVSVNELTSDDVKIYPNPSTGIVNIEFETLTEATLYDISGKLVMTITGLSETINIDQTGLYFLNYKNETKKIIIK